VRSGSSKKKKKVGEIEGNRVGVQTSQGRYAPKRGSFSAKIYCSYFCSFLDREGSGKEGVVLWFIVEDPSLNGSFTPVVKETHPLFGTIARKSSGFAETSGCLCAPRGGAKWGESIMVFRDCALKWEHH